MAAQVVNHMRGRIWGQMAEYILLCDLASTTMVKHVDMVFNTRIYAYTSYAAQKVGKRYIH